MESIEVSTDVRVPPADAYEFLLDFPGYADYSAYLESVRRLDGDGRGGPAGGADGDSGAGDTGAEYALTFAWWKLEHTVRSRVTSVDPPNEIRWELLGQLDATGRWVVEPLDSESADMESTNTRPADAESTATKSRVTLVVTYDADSADPGLIDLPMLVSMDWAVEKATGIVVEEGERVVERVVADLEGERRPVELDVEKRYSSP